MWDFPLFPEQASTMAPRVDNLYFFLVAITAFFTLLIFFLVAFFAIKYRRGTQVDRSNAPASSHKLEVIWIVVPLAIAMVIFAWSTSIYFDITRPPANAREYHVVAKQWMWKFQHPEGKREVNELHVPVGRTVKILMTSEDVIHDLFVPAFRVKQDVLPGRYTQIWFTPTKIGTYHLFCAEYCGTQHSGMIGRMVVMDPVDYQNWLSGAAVGETPAAAGERLFAQYGCNTCHAAGANQRGPSLGGVIGKTVSLKSGETVVADEGYIRESIYTPAAKVVQGYDPVMPSFAGQISEEGVMELIAYIRSLGAAEPTTKEATTKEATTKETTTTGKQ
jgi:cytochrome c oxidase subunit 2